MPQLIHIVFIKYLICRCLIWFLHSPCQVGPVDEPYDYCYVTAYNIALRCWHMRWNLSSGEGQAQTPARCPDLSRDLVPGLSSQWEKQTTYPLSFFHRKKSWEDPLHRWDRNNSKWTLLSSGDLHQETTLWCPLLKEKRWALPSVGFPAYQSIQNLYKYELQELAFPAVCAA